MAPSGIGVTPVTATVISLDIFHVLCGPDLQNAAIGVHSACLGELRNERTALQVNLLWHSVLGNIH
jgi:hypothetical protein